ncbi:MAG: ISKra4 family transposase, partial [Blastocatellia bacterium]
MLFLEAKWSALISYGMSANLLEDLLPMDQTINAFTIRQHLLRVAQRLENSLGEELESFVEGGE